MTGPKEQARIVKVVVLIEEAGREAVTATYEYRKWATSGPLYPRHHKAIAQISDVVREADFCQCLGPHEPGCKLALRLEIKERVCRARGIVSYIPPDVADEIDRLVEETAK